VSLRLQAVTYTYAGAPTPALSSVDLVVEPGRVVGVVGPNGAGKTTLCLCAVGVAPRAIGGTLAGSVEVDGVASAHSPMHELVQRVGILFQEAHTQITSGAPTVWEEIAFGPRNLALGSDEVIERTWSAVHALRISELAERDPNRLSGGQAQLVALAAVLALGPSYLVLDEPTSQLDPVGTRLVGETLASAARATGVGVLIAEHKTDVLAELCDEIVVVQAGRIVTSGQATTVLEDERLPGWGVRPPAPVALRRAAEAAGARWDPSWS
jgi:energy-coupling factor transport system ATP-binding protein